MTKALANEIAYHRWVSNLAGGYQIWQVSIRSFWQAVDQSKRFLKLIYGTNDLTDHLPNFIIFHTFPPSHRVLMCIKKVDKIVLLNEIKEINWEMTFPSDDNPTNMFHSFYDKISTIVDKHIPIKKISKRQLKFN